MKKRRKWPVVVLALALLFLWFSWQQEAIVAETCIVRSAELPEAFDGLRIVHLSDLHGKECGENNARLLAAVKELQPDLIAITGDLIDQVEQCDHAGIVGG